MIKYKENNSIRVWNGDLSALQIKFPEAVIFDIQFPGLKFDEQLNQKTGEVEKRPVPVEQPIPIVPTDEAIDKANFDALREIVKRLASNQRALLGK